MWKVWLCVLLIVTTFVYAELDTNVNGQIVTIKNVGFDVYDQLITLKLANEDNEILITRDTQISPGEEITVDLSKEVYTGVYDLYIDDQLFKSGIVVEGKTNWFSAINYVYVLIGLGVIGLVFVYLLLTRRSRYIKRMKERRNTQQLEQIYTQADPEKKYVQEFRDRMVDRPKVEPKFMPEYGSKKPEVLTRPSIIPRFGGSYVKKPLQPKLRLDQENVTKFREESTFLRKSKLREQGAYNKDKDEN